MFNVAAHCFSTFFLQIWAMSKFVVLDLLWEFPLWKYGLVLYHNFLQEISSCQIGSLLNNLFPKAKEGFILFWKSSNFTFSSRGVILDDGIKVGSNPMVFSTGYDREKKLKSILPTCLIEVLQKLVDPLLLYSYVVHYNHGFIFLLFPIFVSSSSIKCEKMHRPCWWSLEPQILCEFPLRTNRGLIHPRMPHVRILGYP